MNRRSIVVMVALAALATGTPARCEGISITNFSLTSNSVSFSISGNFPSPAPDQNPGLLVFVNFNKTASPGFALGNFLGSSSKSFSGSQSLSTVKTGNSSNGDYFFTSFINAFTANEAISGALTANWTLPDAPAFDPSQVTNLNVFWGTRSSAPFNGAWDSGILLTTVATTSAAVPEIDPAGMGSILALVTGALGLIERRRLKAA